MPHHGGRRSECLFRSARWGRGRADHLDLAIARGRDLVAHVAGQNDATERSGPGILHRVAVDQESVAAKSVGTGFRREGHNMGTVRRRVVRWADVINAPWDGADVGDILHVGVVLALAESGVPGSDPLPVLAERSAQLVVSPHVPLPLLALVAPQHPQHRVDQHAHHAHRNRDLPPDVHQLIVAVARERAAEPDHHVDYHRNLDQEPEESDHRGVDHRDGHDAAEGHQNHHHRQQHLPEVIVDSAPSAPQNGRTTSPGIISKWRVLPVATAWPSTSAVVPISRSANATRVPAACNCPSICPARNAIGTVTGCTGIPISRSSRNFFRAARCAPVFARAMPCASSSTVTTDTAISGSAACAPIASSIWYAVWPWRSAAMTTEESRISPTTAGPTVRDGCRWRLGHRGRSRRPSSRWSPLG